MNLSYLHRASTPDSPDLIEAAEPRGLELHTDSPEGRAGTRLIFEVDLARYRGKPMSAEEIQQRRVQLFEQAKAEIAWETEHIGLVHLDDGRAPDPSDLASMVSFGEFDGLKGAVDALVEHPSRRVLMAISHRKLTPDQHDRLVANAGEMAGPIQSARAIETHFGVIATANAV